MEDLGMEENKNTESHLTSAAAFVEGGIQEACDDACSICLEEFCDSDPSTVTSCKHEFHLQCILEWCQRSSQCPMCWRSISLKDPTSQELFEAVERERTIRSSPPPPRNTTIFHHPTLGDFELQHIPVGANDAELEERIIQHLAAAAAMGRAHHIARRETHRNRSSAQGRPQFLLVSNPNAPSTGPMSASLTAATSSAPPTSPLSDVGEEPSQVIPQYLAAQTGQVPASASGSNVSVASEQDLPFNNRRNSAGQSSPVNQDRAGPSEFQSFSESIKSRFGAASMRYKESITKSTKGWKERLFSRNTSMAGIGSEVKKEVNAGIASVSRLMERLETRENNRTPETRENNRTPETSISANLEGTSVSESAIQRIPETHGSNPLSDKNTPASCTTSSGQN